MTTVAEYIAIDRTSRFSGKRTVEERFWPKVEKTDGCWLWRGATNRGGYGIFQAGVLGKSRSVTAHQVSLCLDGRPLQPGQVTRHLCNTPLCVRPDHLVTGSVLDNVNDMLDAKRNQRGEGIGTSVLSEEQVREIIALAPTHGQFKATAKRYGVGSDTIRRIVFGEAWTHLKRPPLARKWDHVLSPDEVAQIRASLAPTRELARRFSVSVPALYSVRIRRSFRDLPGLPQVFDKEIGRWRFADSNDGDSR